MKQYPIGGTPVYRLNQIVALRSEDIREFDTLNDTKMKGRLRTGVRAVPTAFDDVNADDLEGDVLNDGTYLYRLINDSGTLKWHRESLSISW